MGWSDGYTCRLFVVSHDALSIRVGSSPNAFAGQWKASLQWVKQNIYRGLPPSTADGLLPDGARTRLIYRVLGTPHSRRAPDHGIPVRWEISLGQRRRGWSRAQVEQCPPNSVGVH